MTLRAASLLVLALATPAFAQKVVPIWPQGTPEPAQTTEPEADVTKPTDNLISGHRTARLTNVTRPTITIYAAPGNGPHAAALVFPGGGYTRLAWDGEGVDTCRWLNSIDMTCLLVKYRVPEQGHYPENYADIEDAQQAMRLSRAHAAEWHLDPARIGVIGFSAGGNLAALMSTHADDHHVESTPAAPSVDTRVEAKANFAILGYPAYLSVQPAMTELDPVYKPNALTPPTFLIQAENDKTFIRNSLTYYRALLDAGVPAEMHLYATGGHGFGMHPLNAPEEHWTETATTWLRSIGIVPQLAAIQGKSAGWVGPAGNPCPAPQAVAGAKSAAAADMLTDPTCW